jgi:protein SCO1
MNKAFYYIIGLAILALLGIYLIKKNDHKPLYQLPYYGPDSASSRTHIIQNFSFINQDGQKVELKKFKGKIFVADFFFTTCHTICPIMSNELMRVDSNFKTNKDFGILSHTVDPEIDSVSVLKNYAVAHNASSNWDFVTGKKTELYQQALKSYLIATPQEVTGSEDDFVHSQNLVLIDDEGHIRGFYDGTNKQEVDKLINDIKLLMDEKIYRLSH